MGSVLKTLKTRISQLVIVARLAQRGVLKPGTAPVDGVTDRVLIGPANSAGQGYRWARALEAAHPGTLVTSMHLTADDTFKFPVDLSVHAGYAAYAASWQRAQVAALERYRAVLIESNRGVLGRYRGMDVAQQIALLRDRGVQTGLIFHGSDVRDPDAHLQREPHSYFQVDENFTARMREVTAESQRLIAVSERPVFISTLDLLTEVPHATWLPVVVDPSDWHNESIPLSGEGVPLVVHVPSKSFIKGTDLVEPQLHELRDKGIINYQRVTGVPHEKMPALYRDADIVLDQFRGGPYGVAACEAMAAGRIVVSHVPDRDRIREYTGEDVPILEATHETLEHTLLRVLEDPVHAQRLAAKGPGFVVRHHNGERSGRVLATWLENGSK